MEAYEAFVALALETEGLVVAGPIKFAVSLPTQKVSYAETQTHGYEVDLVGARAEKLVLATVKSFFGSRGVVADHVLGLTSNQHERNRYRMLNDPVVRNEIVRQAAELYGYRLTQIEVRLYVGRFASPKAGDHEQRIRSWCETTTAGGGPIKVYDVHEVVQKVQSVAAKRQYRDNAVLVSLKVLHAAGALELSPPADHGHEL